MGELAAPETIDYLLIGGGLAGATAAEQIRARDARGRMLLVSGDTEYPYHRPPLSKEYLRGEIGARGIYGAGGITVHAPEWYAAHDIDVLRGVEAVALSADRRMVLLSNNRVLRYRSLLLATGGRARRLDVPGGSARGVYALRTLSDADALRAELLGRQPRVVVIGGRFIGLETAASALMRGAAVTLVDPQPRAWPDLMPQAMSDYFASQFAHRGAVLRYGYAPTRIETGPDGRVTAVHIARRDGLGAPEIHPCDVVIVGIGSHLNTELASTSGLAVDPGWGILVNDQLETSAAGIYAAGDVISYPDPVTGRMHFEHWDHAIASGTVAAVNMTGGHQAYRHVPYFFSDQFDLALNVVGYPSTAARIVVRGNPAADTFTAFYVQHDVLRAAVMVNDDAQLDLIRNLIAAAAPVINPTMLRDPAFDLALLLPTLKSNDSFSL